MDWSELNPDLLRLIAKELSELSDHILNFITFRAVCKHWRSAVLPCDLPPQLPWFVETGYGGDGSSKIEFYSLYSKKTHTLHLPEADRIYEIHGASNKYLLLTDLYFETSILVNPFNRSEIQVPYQYEIYHCFYGCCNHGSNPIEHSISAAFLMIDNKSDEDKSILFLYRSYDKVWTNVEVEMCDRDGATLYKGILYIHDKAKMDTRLIDITNGDLVSVISGQGINFDYLVDAFQDLLGVVKLLDDPNVRDCRFKVYRLDKRGNTPYWTEMSQGIGNRILFIDWLHAFCLEASAFDGVKGNTIYFTKWNGKSCVICRYDLEDNTTQVLKHLDLLDNLHGTWFVPSLC